MIPSELEGFFFVPSGVVLCGGACVKVQEGRFFSHLPPHLLIAEVISTACRWNRVECKCIECYPENTIISLRYGWEILEPF